jgi:hypothetical protein
VAASEAEELDSYRAPALEMGLDILELLPTTEDGLSQAKIAKALERSPNEICRMLDRLVRRERASRLQVWSICPSRSLERFGTVIAALTSPCTERLDRKDAPGKAHVLKLLISPGNEISHRLIAKD